MNLQENEEANLRSDLDRLAERFYSEEGIPMFLVCEDLAPNGAAQEPLTLASLNDDLASAFSRDAETWQRIRPDPPVAEACKIVELLADRDFGPSGTENKP